MSDSTKVILTEKKFWWHFHTQISGSVWLPCDEVSKEDIDKRYGANMSGSIGFTVGHGVCIKSDDPHIAEDWEVYEDIDDAQELYNDWLKEVEGK